MAPKGAPNPWSTFYLLDRSESARKATWDPWPVTGRYADPVLENAMAIVKKRNSTSIDHCLDRIVLLPASGNTPYVQGGTQGLFLYSLRSPSFLPVRIQLWMTPGLKVMALKGRVSIPLEKYLQRIKPVCWDFEKHYDLWNSLSYGTALATFKISPQLQGEFHQRWWRINGFRFLDLPGELRETIYDLAFAHYICFGENKSLYKLGRKRTQNPRGPSHSSIRWDFWCSESKVICTYYINTYAEYLN